MLFVPWALLLIKPTVERTSTVACIYPLSHFEIRNSNLLSLQFNFSLRASHVRIHKIGTAFRVSLGRLLPASSPILGLLLTIRNSLLELLRGGILSRHLDLLLLQTIGSRSCWI